LAKEFALVAAVEVVVVVAYVAVDVAVVGVGMLLVGWVVGFEVATTGGAPAALFVPVAASY
jgi:hypothetical protein